MCYGVWSLILGAQNFGMIGFVKFFSYTIGFPNVWTLKVWFLWLPPGYQRRGGLLVSLGKKDWFGWFEFSQKFF